MTALITPRPGQGVCPRCFNFTREGSGICRACRASGDCLDAMVAISYALAGGSLHRELADYKRAAEPAVPDLADDLARLLSEFLEQHEACLAHRAGVGGFERVTVVPSSDPHRDRSHPLRGIVTRQVSAVRGRYGDVLRASGKHCIPHAFDPNRFSTDPGVAGETVLLIDDVWTTGACAQSAAAALRAAGASHVAALVIGRYVNGCWGDISQRLMHMQPRYRSSVCSLCWPSPRRHGTTESPARGRVQPDRSTPWAGVSPA